MKKGVMFLAGLLVLSMAGCNNNGTEGKISNEDSVVDISIGDWMDGEASPKELCKVVNVPTQAKILYTNGYSVDNPDKDKPVIVTQEKDESVGNMAVEDYIWLSLEYDASDGIIDTASYSVSDSWSKIKEDDTFTKFKDAVYEVSETGSMNVYMCLDEESNKALCIDATFNKSKLNDEEKVEMLLETVKVTTEDKGSDDDVSEKKSEGNKPDAESKEKSKTEDVKKSEGSEKTETELKEAESDEKTSKAITQDDLESKFMEKFEGVKKNK